MPPEFQYLNPYGVGQPGAPVQGGGGGGGSSTMGSLRRVAPGEVPEPFFRDDLDFQRSMYRRIPSAEYPDGYLGTMRLRRDDRVMGYVQGRVTERQYQRGVHKGERIDPSDYFWLPEFNPQSGLAAQAQGRRQAPAAALMGRAAVTERQMIPRGSQSLIEVSPERAMQLRRLAPDWR
jgi:hypothetical protein